MCREAYPLRYSGGAISALDDRQRARFPQVRRFRGESGALAHIRRGHCTEVDTPCADMGGSILLGCMRRGAVCRCYSATQFLASSRSATGKALISPGTIHPKALTPSA